jgi:bifunctional NMN adenylyltransferase/nudix hydrolase
MPFIHKNIVFTGRMQHLQSAHVDIIAQGFTIAEKVVIVLGSVQESGTIRNPFTVATRAQLIRDVFGHFGDRLIIIELPDYTNENDHSWEWGRYLLDHIEAALGGEKVECMIYGNDEVRQDWFSPEDQAGIHNIIIPHPEDRISATKVRKYLALNLYAAWQMDTPGAIHHRYEALREELLQVEFYRDLGSIL